MNIFKKTFNIKNIFPRAKGPVVNNPYSEQDAKLLSEMCVFSSYINASDRINYWYYHTYDYKNLDTVEYILNRNGIVPELHFSEFHKIMGWVYRAKKRNLSKQNKEFIDNVDSPRILPKTLTPESQIHLLRIQHEMKKQKQK